MRDEVAHRRVGLSFTAPLRLSDIKASVLLGAQSASRHWAIGVCHEVAILVDWGDAKSRSVKRWLALNGRQFSPMVGRTMVWVNPGTLSVLPMDVEGLARG